MSDIEQTTTADINPVELAAELTAAWLANPNTRSSANDVPAFLRSMHDAIVALTPGEGVPQQSSASTSYEPAVSVRKSRGSPDHIISLIDGKPYKTLRRHLSTHGLTPDEYRQRYKLKADYPMVASAYSEARRAMAKTIGLGRKPGAKSAKSGKPAEAAAPKPSRRGRAAKNTATNG